MEITANFIQMFSLGVYLFMPLLIVLISLIIVLGQVVGRLENWNRLDALYWSLITALTVGYGDIRPSRNSTKLLSVLVALIGIMFTGVVVAITVAAATKALRSVIDVSTLLANPVGI